ncbi:DUF2961 domain-containing protein [Candidatus Poribacteria bacterium]|nr:DUF2961 domain-containing protein [Candidatus Poribacteria bacterium]
MPTSSLSGGSVRDLAVCKNFKAKRVSSWDRTGGNSDRIPIDPGATATLADISCPGIIRHIWFTISCEDKFYLRKLLLKMYWDDEKVPSVEVPVGDFFGVGHAKRRAYSCAVLNMSDGNGEYGGGTAINCYFPMPFAEHARIEILNECELPVRSFYYYIDYEEHESVENMGQFHAQWRRENPCKAVQLPGGKNIGGAENYIVLEAEGRGHYVGCNVSIHNMSEGWWGEGDDMIFVDGEQWPPSLHGTGTEDYFCHAWGMDDQAYPYHGTSLFNNPHGNDNWKGKWTIYRYHILDPIPFEKSIRVTIEHGHANDRGDDWSSVGYWYQTEPHKLFPTMLPVEERLPRPD